MTDANNRWRRTAILCGIANLVLVFGLMTEHELARAAQRRTAEVLQELEQTVTALKQLEDSDANLNAAAEELRKTCIDGLNHLQSDLRALPRAAEEQPVSSPDT